MVGVHEWMLRAMRDDAERLQKMPLQWLEFERDRFASLVMNAISFIMNGGTFLLCSDDRCEWFKGYVLSKLNNCINDRPLVPIYELDISMQRLLDGDDANALPDLLEMSYNSYAMWYIGCGNNKIAQFAMQSRNSFLWMFDESLEHSFVFNSNDSNLDFKLIQAYGIFEKALFATIHGEINIDEYNE